MQSIVSRVSWVVVPSANRLARLRLICFPHAGAGASTFAAWPASLPADIEVCGIQMPGREGRLREPPISDWHGTIARIADAVAPWLDRPFALFGHSLGAVLAFELARHLRRQRQAAPVRLFVSGREAPQLPPSHPRIGGLSPMELVERLGELAGTPPGVLRDQELMDIFLPTIRADFQLSETYVYRHDAPLDTPIMAYGGMQDPHVPAGLLDGWREQTIAIFRRVMLPGGHFFVKDARATVLADIGRELTGR